jgi:hypothetical protein
MKKQIWGNATWYLFHTLAYKLKPECAFELPALFEIIKLTCENLPCPICQAHACELINKADKNKVTGSQEQFKEFLFHMHNRINFNLGNTIFTLDEYNLKYSKAKTINIIKHFIFIMSNTQPDMTQLVAKQIYITTFKAYINNNFKKYYM